MTCTDGCCPADLSPGTANAPGQPTLSWRAAPYGASLARMRSALARSDQLQLRVLAQHGPDEPAIAILDAWALVADTLSFYTERIATESFLRTATELLSVRELARTLGYELRPGVAAQADLSFTVESAPGAPAVVDVPAGTPVQTVPGAGQLPQTFETVADLEARAVWNSIPAVAAHPQVIGASSTEIWVRGTGLGLRPGDVVVAVGAERRGIGAADDPGRDAWLLRTVTQSVESPVGLPGWTRVDCAKTRNRVETAPEDTVEVIAFTQRGSLFGWNAPDYGLLSTGTAPVAAPRLKAAETQDPTIPVDPNEFPTDDIPADPIELGEWPHFEVLDDQGGEGGGCIELDGEHARLLAGSWIVLEDPRQVQLYLAAAVTPSGAAKYGLSGRITRVQPDMLLMLQPGIILPDPGGGDDGGGPVDPGGGIDPDTDISTVPPTFDRRTAIVHLPSRTLAAGEAPRLQPVSGDTIDLVATDPPLPAGRPVLISGTTADLESGPGVPIVQASTVLSCAVSADGTAMTVVLDPPLAQSYDPQTVTVLGNVVTAGHGETVQQVLGSGDGRVAFAQFSPRRTPLTYVRATTPDGAASTLVLRVDDVAWSEVPSLDAAAAGDRAYAIKLGEGGAVRLVTGDGVHGARLTTGIENVTATYRVGIGQDGAATAGQLRLLTRRPAGIKTVTNPAPASDWAAPEQLEDARRNAPLRTRTLDRAVSLIDHEDFAAAYAGVGLARADAVWDGHRQVVAVSVLGTGAVPVSAGLLTDLRAALDGARDVTQPLAVLPGTLVWFGVRFDLLTDPAHLRAVVEQDVVLALQTQLGHPARQFASPVTAAEVLVVVTAVAGVVACTMPLLLPLAGPAGPPEPTDPTDPPGAAARPQPLLRADPTPSVTLLPARPARLERGTVIAAQLLGLATDSVEIGVMA